VSRQSNPHHSMYHHSRKTTATDADHALARATRYSEQIGIPLGELQNRLGYVATNALSDKDKRYLELRRLLFNALCKPNIFPELDVAHIKEVASISLTRMLSLPQAQVLRETFAGTGLDMEIGFNQGTGLLRLIFSLPTPEQQMRTIRDERQAVLWAALGILHDQARLEEDYAVLAQMYEDELESNGRADLAQCIQKFNTLYAQSSASWGPSSSFPRELVCSVRARVNKLLERPSRLRALPLLANHALEIFISQTGVAITERKIDFEQATMTITVRSARNGVRALLHAQSGVPPALALLLRDDERGDIPPNPNSAFLQPPLYADDGTLAYRHCPTYTLLTGAVPEAADLSTLPAKSATSYWSHHAFDAQKVCLVKQALEAFWDYATNVLRYYPNAILKEQVSQALESFMLASADALPKGHSEFNVTEPLVIFLNGTAGTGKSTFVRVFTAALRFVVGRLFEPSKRMDIIRVPFNQMTPEALAALLMVRGISDWSIERIVEQTVCRGGIAMLHLEEQPSDKALQTNLFFQMQNMTKTLLGRYPNYINNVISILTSNYDPSPEIAKISKYVYIEPPSQEIQAEWCARTLEDLIASNLLRVQFRSLLSCRSSAAERKRDTQHSNIKINYQPHPATPPYFSHNTVRSAVAVTYASPSRALQPFERPKQLVQFYVPLELKDPPRATRDMRKLETWKSSIGFCVLVHLTRHLSAFLAETGVCPELETLVEEMCAPNPPRKVVALVATLAIRATLRKVPQPNNVDCYAITFNTIDKLGQTIVEEQPAIPELRLYSQDSFFFAPPHEQVSQVPMISQAPAFKATASNCLPNDSLPRIRSALQMWLANFLKPAVIVLHGPSEKIQRAALEIRKAVFEHAQMLALHQSQRATADLTAIQASTVGSISGVAVEEELKLAQAAEPVPATNILRRTVDPSLSASDTSLLCAEEAARHLLPKIPKAELDSINSIVAQHAETCEKSAPFMVTEFFARALDDLDQRMLMGDPDPSTGTLLRFIHSINAENGGAKLGRRRIAQQQASASGSDTADDQSSSAVGIVWALANEHGQFTLRELLDAGESNTHVTSVRKEGLLFVVLVPEDSQIQPQVVSRAHEIVIFK